MNGPTRLKLYSIIVKRDGEFCKGCHSLPSEKQLVIDHVDNNNANNQLGNLQLLCRACNYVKNPRRPVDLCVNERNILEENSEIEINRKKEPQFRRYVQERLNEKDQISEKELINSSAERLGLSPVTTKRYLEKMCSEEGICEKVTVGNTCVIRRKKELSFI